METFQRVYREVPIEFIVVLHEIKNRERKKRLIKLIFTSRFYNSRVHTDNSNHPRINWSTRQRLFLDSSSFSPLLWFRFFTFFMSSISIFAKNNNFPLLFFDVRTRHSIIHIYFSQFSNTWPKYEIIFPLFYLILFDSRGEKWNSGDRFAGEIESPSAVSRRLFRTILAGTSSRRKKRTRQRRRNGRSVAAWRREARRRHARVRAYVSWRCLRSIRPTWRPTRFLRGNIPIVFQSPTPRE